MKRLLTILLLGIPLFSLSQNITEGMVIVEFNASFSNTSCTYLEELTDVEIFKIDIFETQSAQAEYKIAVVPTLIIFKEGEEMERFQANIMMQLEATKKEVQEKIDEIIMSDF